MSTVLEDVIHPDQAYAVPGRKITDSLVLTRDAICYARDRNIRLVVLNFDFEKAFDRVSHQYLFQVLQKMGFPKRFIAWVGLPLMSLVCSVFNPPKEISDGPREGSVLFSVGVQVGKTEEGGGQKETRKRWKRPPRPPPVFRQPLHRSPHKVRCDPLPKDSKDFTSRFENSSVF